MNKNLILGTALGYDWSQLRIFVKSLRKVSSCDVFFLVGKIDTKTQIELNKYKIKTIKCNLTPENFRFRYSFYSKFLDQNLSIYKKCLMTDVRDVFFQSDPFNKKIDKIHFFEEPEKFNNCLVNSVWLKLTYGSQKYKEYMNKNIICGGIIIGKTNYILKYCKLLSNEVKYLRMKFTIKHFFFARKIKNGIDQPACNYVVYSNKFDEFNIHSNENGCVATCSHMKNFSFDKKNQLLNNNNKIYAIVHQYDRFSKYFEKYISKFTKDD